MKQLTRHSSSWLERLCFIGTVLSLETMADCFWCAQKDLVLAGRLPVNKPHILLFQPDFQAAFPSQALSLVSESSDKTETKNTAQSVPQMQTGSGKVVATGILLLRCP